MVTVRIDSTGEELDVIGNVAFVKQVNDIGDITKATSSYTWQLTFPKSPRNTTILKGLGIAGSTSTIPYDKIVCQILYNGQTVEPNGNLIITETVGKDYKGHVKAGLIDFLQDISNDKISDVIDLSSLSHLNTVANIIDSFTADLPYKYIIAYYNGQKLPNESGVTNLNPFALVPSISIKYLWDAIFAHYGWTYSGNFDFTDLWMTYPEAIAYSTDGSILALDADYPVQNRTQDNVRILNPTINTIDTDFVEQKIGFPEVFVLQQTSNYRLRAIVDGFSEYRLLGIAVVQTKLYFKIVVGGLATSQWIEANGTNEYDIEITGTTGMHVAIFVRGEYWTNSLYTLERNRVTSASFTIQTLGVQEIDFSAALIKIKVKDFFKEIMVRNALTPFVDVENKAIRFRPLDERLNAPKVDWSSKYVKQGRSEKYVYNQYAQKNIIKHKYNDPNEDWANGVLFVDNQNQPEEKDLYNSFTYAPEQTLVEYNGTNFPSYFVQNFRMFDVEVSEDADTGDLIANYKQLKDRFYVIKAEQRIDDIYILGELAEEFPLAVYSEVFGDIVFDDYSNMNQLIDNAKILTIDLMLSLVDVVMLDFYKRYYFEQERAYFILNSLTWKPNELAKGEFVKINS